MPNRLNNRVTLLTKKEMTVSQFRGLDRSTSRFSVASYRAIDELNYVYKDGVLQKREGYEEILNVKKEAFYEYPFSGDENKDIIASAPARVNGSTRINGIWFFRDAFGVQHCVAHVGNLLYEFGYRKGENIFTAQAIIKKIIKDKKYAYFFDDYRSSAFIGNNCLWFLGGNRYMRISGASDTSLKVVPVDSIAYVPTTTVSITYLDSPVSKRESLDSVNMLTPMRKNLLLSGTIARGSESVRTTKYYEYTLDTDIKPEKTGDITGISVEVTCLKEDRQE